MNVTPKTYFIMKKLFLLLALVGFMTACGSNESSPKQKVYKTLNEMYDALYDDSPRRFISLFENMETTYDNASEEERIEIDKATDQWVNDNPRKFELIELAIQELND